MVVGQLLGWLSSKSVVVETVSWCMYVLVLLLLLLALAGLSAAVGLFGMRGSEQVREPRPGRVSCNREADLFLCSEVFAAAAATNKGLASARAASSEVAVMADCGGGLRMDD